MITGYLDLKQVAELYHIAPSYLRRIVADRYRRPHGPRCHIQCKDPEHRRYDNSIHERFPQFFRDGRRWLVSQQTLANHMERRGRVLEPRV